MIDRIAKSLMGKEKGLVSKVDRRRQAVFERFPLVFTLLGAFGLVATFYGFERIIDNIAILSENPWVLLGTGIGVLAITGSLYKKLQ